MPPTPDLSIIIPAYREAKRLPTTLQTIYQYLCRRDSSHEIIVVDDGSPDETAFVCLSLGIPTLRVVRLLENRGKGAALRVGVLTSHGRRVLLTDADLSTPIEELEKLEPLLQQAPLVLGSRARPDSRVEIHQPWYREQMGRTFNLFLRLLGLTRIPDTQCGFKLLDGPIARELFSELTIDGFAYDVELLWLAKQRGFPFVDVGVRWINSPDSRVHPIRDAARMIFDVLRLRFRCLRMQRRV